MEFLAFLNIMNAIVQGVSWKIEVLRGQQVSWFLLALLEKWVHFS